MAMRKPTDRCSDDKVRRLTRPSGFWALLAVPAAVAVVVAAGLASSQSAVAGTAHAGATEPALVRQLDTYLPPRQPKPTVVLVHGAWADASSWSGEVATLQAAGYDARAIANPLQDLTTDSEYVADYLKSIKGPIVLVGHSYGGAVITGAGTHQNVAALVYIAAFMPDAGESVNTLIAGFPSDVPGPPILPPKNGLLFLDRGKFRASFAGDLPKLVSGHDPGPHDSPASPADNVPAGRLNGDRGGGQPFGLPLTTARRGRSYRASRRRMIT